MRKFLLFVATGLVLISVRLYPSELKKRESLGSYTAFDKRDREVVSVVRQKYDRLDFNGGEYAAKAFINELGAEILFTESAGGTQIYYCYARKIPDFERLYGKKINLVVAVNGDEVAVGSPLLKGSY